MAVIADASQPSGPSECRFWRSATPARPPGVSLPALRALRARLRDTGAYAFLDNVALELGEHDDGRGF
jgi:hypothetical protein